MRWLRHSAARKVIDVYRHFLASFCELPTRDVDALFEPHGIVHDEALAVAAELGLPRWWLNEQASTYVAPGGDPAASRVFDHPGLRVFAASPEHLLAMKAFAARPRDAEDLRQLIGVLDLHTADDVLATVREIFPEEEPPNASGFC
jgi:hypothetical protein